MRTPEGISDLIQSERGVFCLLVLVCATVLAVLGKLDSSAWIDFMKYLVGALVASKTITTAVETASLKKAQRAAPAPEPAP